MFSHSHGNAETEGKFPTVKYIIDMPSVARFGSDIRYSHSGITDRNNRAKAARGKRIAGCGGFKDAERFRSAHASHRLFLSWAQSAKLWGSKNRSATQCSRSDVPGPSARRMEKRVLENYPFLTPHVAIKKLLFLRGFQRGAVLGRFSNAAAAGAWCKHLIRVFEWSLTGKPNVTRSTNRLMGNNAV